MRGRREIRDRYYGRGDRNLLFHAFGHVPGINTLSPLLTINSQTVEPFFRYKGGDASLSGWPAWGYGVDLGYQSGAAPDFNELGPGLGDSDLGVKFNGGAYFSASANNIDTEDFVIEAVGRIDYGNSGPKYVLGTRPDLGYSLIYNNQDIIFKIEDTVTSFSSSRTFADAFFHCFYLVNRDENSANGFSWYLNGQYVASGDPTSVQLSLDDGSDFAIGSSSNGGSPCSGFIHYVAAWKKSNWLPAGAAGPVEYAVIAAERFHRWSGMWPTKAVGTWAPTVATRAFGAYLENQDAASPYTKRIYQVGSEHLRVQRVMVDGEPFIGYLAEPQVTNLIPESEDLATTWAATRCTISQDAIDTPDGDNRTVVDGIVASVDNDSHYVEITPGWEDGEWQWARFRAKAGDVDWLRVELTNSGEYAYIDVANGVVGADSMFIGPWVDAVGDFWQITILESIDSTDALRIYPSDGGAVGNEVFAGDGSTPSVYVWGVQAEDSSVNSPSSLINTDGATGTRLADVLKYKGDDGNIPVGAGRLSFKMVAPDPDKLLTPSGSRFVFLALSDGGAAADSIIVYYQKSEGVYFIVDVASTGGNAGSVAVAKSILDGEIHTIEVVWRQNYLNIAVDGVWGTPDTSVDIPDELDRIELCRDLDGTQWGGYLVSDVKIWSR